MNTPSQKKLALIVSLVLLACSALFASPFPTTLGRPIDDGTSDAAHPAEFLTDGSQATVWQARADVQRASIILPLAETRHVLGLKLFAYGNPAVRLSVEYDVQGRFVPFLSAIGQQIGEGSAEKSYDLSLDNVETSRLRLIFEGKQLGNLAVQELSVQSENLQAQIKKIAPIAIKASENTSRYASEDELFDGNPLSYWLVEQSPRLDIIHWFVDDYAKIRWPFSRDKANWLQGWMECDVPAQATTDHLRLYTTAHALGSYQIEVKTAQGWTRIQNMQAVGPAGWQEFSVKKAISKIRITVQTPQNQNNFAGFGELEIWGSGTAAPLVDSVVVKGFPGLDDVNALQEEIFAWNPVNARQLPTVAVAYDLALAIAPSILLNGFEKRPRSSCVQGNELIAYYAVEPGDLLTGDNFLEMAKGPAGQVVKARGFRVFTPADTGIIQSTHPWLDGQLSTAMPGAQSSMVLPQAVCLDKVDLITVDGSTPGLSAKVGNAWISLTGIGLAEGIASFDGSNLISSELRVEGNAAAVAELRVWGSKTDAGMAISLLYPVSNQAMPVENHGFQALYGELSDPDAKVTVNGKAAKQYGQLFWIDLKDIRDKKFEDLGIYTVHIVATRANGQTAIVDRSWFVEDSGYELVLSDTDHMVYTASDTYAVRGSYNPYVTSIVINGATVPESGRSINFPVKLKAGLNLIKVEQFAKNPRKSGHIQYIRVYYQADALKLAITSHPLTFYTTESTMVVRGMVRGLSPVSVSVKGQGATVEYPEFYSAALKLSEGKNTIAIVAKDALGNTATQTLTVYRDSTPPLFTIVSPVNKAIINTPYVILSGTATDASPFRIFANGVVAVLGEKNSYQVQVPCVDGQTKIDVYAIDQAGNKSAIQSREYLVDATAPQEFPVLVNPASWNSGANQTVTFATTDATSGVDHYELKTDEDAAFAKVTSPASIHLNQDGEHVISVKAIDKAGNVRLCTGIAYIDRTPPAAVEQLRGVPGNGLSRVRFNLEEVEFDHLQIRRVPAWSDGNHSIPKSAGVREQVETHPNRYAFEYSDMGLANGSSYQYFVTAIDRAGNQSAELSSDSISVGIATQNVSTDVPTIVEFDGATIALASNSLQPNIQKIQIEVIESPDLRAAAALPIAGPIYHFSAINNENGTAKPQENVAFAKPFVASIRYDDSQLWSDFPAERLAVFYFDTTWGRWFRVPESLVDAKNKQVTFSVDHFTNFSVQPTMQNAVSAQEWSSVGYSLASSATRHDGFSISTQGGSVSTQMTEFTLPGNNGFNFEVRRMYDTSTAKNDAFEKKTLSSLKRMFKDFSVLSIEDFNEKPNRKALIDQLMIDNNASVNADENESYAKALGRSGDYAYSMGKGWRLNLPYMSWTDASIMVRTPSGGNFDLGQMYLIKNTNTGSTRVLTLENHRGEDFQIEVTQSYRVNGTSYSGSVSTAPSSEYSAWYMDSAKLTTKDGSVYSFDGNGRLLNSSDPTGKNTIAVTYNGNTIDTIQTISGADVRTLSVEYKSDAGTGKKGITYIDGRPYISKIKQMDSDGNTVIRSASYEQDASGNLISATDVIERKYTYTYEDLLLIEGSSLRVNFKSVTDYVFSAIGESAAALNDDVMKKLNSSDADIEGDLSTQIIHPLSSISGPGIGYQTVDYKVKPLSYVDITVNGQGLLNYIFSNHKHGTISVLDFVAPASHAVSTAADAEIKSSTNYTYNVHYAFLQGKQILPDSTVVDDGRIKQEYTYQIKTQPNKRLTMTDDHINLVEAGDKLLYLPSLDSTKKYDITVAGKETLLETVTTTTDDLTLRTLTQKIVRGPLTYSEQNFSYDFWGNAIKTTVTESVNGKTSTDESYHLYGLGSNPSAFESVIYTLYAATISNTMLDAWKSASQGTAITFVDLMGLLNQPITRHDALTLTAVKNIISPPGQVPETVQWIVGKTTYTISSFNQAATVESLVDGSWLTTQYAYDQTSGELVKITSPEGAVTEIERKTDSKSYFSYKTTRKDVAPITGTVADIETMQGFNFQTGFKTFERSGRGYVTTYDEYDMAGRIKYITQPSDTEAADWDPISNPVAGRHDRTTHPLNPITGILYVDKDMTVTVTKPSLQTESYVFDNLGRVSTINRNLAELKEDNEVLVTAATAKSSFTYDKYSQLSGYTNPLLSETSFAYDATGRLSSTTFPDASGKANGPSATSSWDAAKNTLTSTDENGVVTKTIFDFKNRPLSKTVAGYSETWEYDSVGQVIAYQDRNGKVTKNSYDERGKLLIRTNPTADIETSSKVTESKSVVQKYVYNKDGYLLKESRGYGSVLNDIFYVVDSLGRKIQQRIPYSSYALTTASDPTITYSTSTSDNSVTLFVYDKDGNLTTVYDANNVKATTNSYEPIASAKTISYTYSPRGLKTSETNQEGAKTSYEYDLDGNLKKMTDPRGFSIDYVYDSFNRLVKALPPKVSGQTSAPTVSFEYDLNGGVTKRKDSSGSTTTYGYTTRGWLSSETVSYTPTGGTAISYVSGYSYDNVGNRTSVTDTAKKTTSYGYDGLRRLTSITHPVGNRESFSYDGNGNKSMVIDGNGHSTSWTYDALNRPTSQTDALGQKYLYYYNFDGQVVRYKTPLEYEYTNQYDERGLLVQETSPRGTIYKYSYNDLGQMTDSLDPNGNLSEYQYNDVGSLDTLKITSTATKALVHSQTYTYDLAGLLKTAKDQSVTTTYNTYKTAAETTASYHSDPYGLVHQLTETGAGTNDIKYTYDAQQNLTGIQVNALAPLTYNYDALNRVTQVNALSATVLDTTISYDAAGRLQDIVLGNTLTRTNSYDDNSRLIGAITKTATNKTLRSDQIGFDGANNVASKTVNGTFISTYNYDARNSLLKATQQGRFAADMAKDQNPMKATRDVTSQKSLEIVTKTTTVNLDYDSQSVGVDLGETMEVYGFQVTPQSANRITDRNLQVWLSDSNLANSYTPYTDIEITKTASTGAITIRFRTPQWARYAKLHCTFDERAPDNSAINHATAQNTAGLLVKTYYYAKNQSETYTYDNDGRRTAKTIDHPQNERDDESSTYTYYDKSELLKSDGTFNYQYDANGNLIAKGTSATAAGVVNDSGTAWYYEYDALNRLTTVKKWNATTNAKEMVASYTYNHKNERIKKVDAHNQITRWAYDGNGNALAVYYPDGTSESLVWLQGTVFARVLTKNSVSEVQYYVTDILGSTVMLTDASGNILSQNDTDTFGNQTGSSGFDDLAMRYTGKDFDPDTGLYYFNARWYDPNTGRFISEDPVQAGSGWYDYCNNNPMSSTDATGLMTPEETAAYYAYIAGQKITKDESGNISSKERDSSDSDFSSLDNARDLEGGHPDQPSAPAAITISDIKRFKSVYERSYINEKVKKERINRLAIMLSAGDIDPEKFCDLIYQMSMDIRSSHGASSAGVSDYNARKGIGDAYDNGADKATIAYAALKPGDYFADAAQAAFSESDSQNSTAGIAFAGALASGGLKIKGGSTGAASASKAKPAQAYNRLRDYGRTPTAADRKALRAGADDVVDHNPPLVQRYYEGDPAIGERPGFMMTPAERSASAQDRSRMQLQPRTDSNRQGAQMQKYSRQKKGEFGL